MDYQLQVLAKSSYVSTAAFAAFMGSFGLACNTVLPPSPAALCVARRSRLHPI